MSAKNSIRPIEGGWISGTEKGITCISWLSRAAAKGKSATAHTIANWYIERGGLVSCFCFAESGSPPNIHHYGKRLGGLQPYPMARLGRSDS